jgi:hypothetical protein
MLSCFFSVLPVTSCFVDDFTAVFTGGTDCCTACVLAAKENDGGAVVGAVSCCFGANEKVGAGVLSFAFVGIAKGDAAVVVGVDNAGVPKPKPVPIVFVAGVSGLAKENAGAPFVAVDFVAGVSDLAKETRVFLGMTVVSAALHSHLVSFPVARSSTAQAANQFHREFLQTH